MAPCYAHLLRPVIIINKKTADLTRDVIKNMVAPEEDNQYFRCATTCLAFLDCIVGAN